MNQSKLILAFLDVACCAAASLLIVILFAETEGEQHDPAEAIFIECEQVSGSPRTVGIQYREPGSEQWLLPSSDSGGLIYSVNNGIDAKGKAYLLIAKPKVGEWYFRGIQVEFPSDKDDSPADVKLRVIGNNFRAARQHNLSLPSEHTRYNLSVRIGEESP